MRNGAQQASQLLPVARGYRTNGYREHESWFELTNISTQRTRPAVIAASPAHAVID